ncbi:ATP-binding protein [Haloterrigena sp. SYSU A558-1]|uniref:ATP-binding protein n=1 Tax=Haloterrigena gelatinilytica TaxID=2741724 RepID=A0ABX2LDG6_9EURY|nr:ATP-binding protein [Haloterrigena gelatinilytica]NUC73460.1 ATP-binding protein [Haloterrigena gelatinilytica]
MILVICGPPGAGKTTIAGRLRRRLEARDDPVPVRIHHSDDFSRRTYEQLFERARDDPREAITIVDGTFYEREWQTQFRTLGFREEIRFVTVTASLETCLERNRTRAEPIEEQGVHVVYREFDAPEDALEIDTDEASVGDAVDRIVGALESWNWLTDRAE